jgi:type IV secretory pathway TrbD component
MGTVFVGKWSRRIFVGCILFGLGCSVVGIIVCRLWMMAVGVPVVVVGLYGLVGLRRMDPL